MGAIRIDPPKLTEQDIRRFHKKIDKTPGLGPKGDCWEWRGTQSNNGYGKFAVRHGFRHGRNVLAHRVAFFLATSDWPITLCVLHRCDNRACCNADHLWLGTYADNNHDAAVKGRHPKGLELGCYKHPETRPRGERHHARKLSDKIVRQMRQLWKEGYSQGSIARRFGVSQSVGREAILGITWSHVL